MGSNGAQARLRAKAGAAPVLAAQYFRPPFPERHRWVDDLHEMRRAGLSAAYVWVCWGWVEPEPGRFQFDDYDELIEAADRAGLKIVFNTIAEIHPFWIHREIPDASLVDHTGRKVISVPRRECLVGLTPGGCIDHPDVLDLMGKFLKTTAERYASADALLGWDLWNETRWAVHSGGQVCYCDHTLSAFRQWLAARYGSLDELNVAWHRRYGSWEEVDPGRLVGSTYTDHMEFQAFLTERAAEHMRFRHDVVRAVDAENLIVAHAMSPAPFGTKYEDEQAMSRGNDWDYTDFLDGFGASLFPAWVQGAGAEFGARIECSRAAAQDRVFWVGELQGGSGRGGIEVNQSLTGPEQQRWLWRSYARGAKAVSFWCWRDEVFGRESSGFGIAGNDGCAEQRIEGLGRSRELLDTHAELLGDYQPDHGRIGVIFEPLTYQMDWAQYGPDFAQSKGALLGYLYALERAQLTYEVIEARHRSRLDECRLIIMPWPLIVDPDLASELVEWIRRGGTLLVESELDAYNALGFYRYPDERPFADALGLRSLGRRPIPAEALEYDLDGRRGSLAFATWAEPLALEDSSSLEIAGSVSHAHRPHDSHAADGFLCQRNLGAGKVIALGTFAGLAYHDSQSDSLNGLEGFMRRLAQISGAHPGISCDHSDGEQVTLRTGLAGDRRLVFVTDETPGRALRVRLDRELLHSNAADAELLAGESLSQTHEPGAHVLMLRTDAWGLAIVSLPA